MATPDLNKLLDKRSQKLWEEINNHFAVTLEFHDDPNYGLYSKGKSVTLFIAKYNYNRDYFAHELLHLLLEIKNINISGYLKIRFRENQLLSIVFTDPLISHIGNTLDHIKMLDIYLKLGFDRTQFLYDYYDPKCTDFEIQLIKTYIDSHSEPSLRNLSIDLFVGKFFAIKSCPNILINYEPYLSQLKKLNSELFSILEVFWNSWLSYDIEKYDLRDYNYWDLSDTFYNSLHEWTLVNTT